MTYSSGGLIQAADFNGFAGGSPGANVSGQINSVWSVGYGNAGYGQTRVSNVAIGGTVAASDWASLINATNAARKHQSGVGYSNIGVPTAGTTITYLSTLSGAITDAYTNRQLDASGVTSVATLDKTISVSAAAGANGSGSQSWAVTFASVDAARYFFNAGGYITIGYKSSTTNGTARSASQVTLAQTNFASDLKRDIQWDGRTGTGGTVVTNLTTNKGYYGSATAAYETIVQINSTSYYSSDYMYMQSYQTGGAGSYGANGNVINILVFHFSSATGSTQPSDTCSASLVYTCTAWAPTTTYLTNTWGTPTIA